MLRIGEVADRLGLSVEHVRRLTNTGELSCTRTAGGHRRFPEDDVAAFETGEHRTARTHPGRARNRVPIPIFDDAPDEVEYLDEEVVGPLPDEVPPPGEPRQRREPVAVPPPPPPAPSSPVPITPTVPETIEPRVDLAALKSVGRAWIPLDVPPEWQARAVNELQRYVTAEHFPSCISAYEHHEMVHAKVQEILQQLRAEQDRDQAQQQDEQRREQKRQQREREKQEEERDRQSLISYGKRYAHRGLMEIHPRDRFKARRELEEILDGEIGADWEKDDVEELVDDVVREFLDDDTE